MGSSGQEERPDGFFIKPRFKSITESFPAARGLWDYLLYNARFRDGKDLKEGQMLTSIPELRDALSWGVGWRLESYSPDQIKRAVAFLKKNFITAEKKGRKLLITITKYKEYKNPAFYIDMDAIPAEIRNAQESAPENALASAPENFYERTREEVDKENNNSNLSGDIFERTHQKNFMNAPENAPRNTQKSAPDSDPTFIREIREKEGEEETPSSSCPQKKIIALYHKILPELPSIKVWGDSSSKHLRARWRSNNDFQSLEFWRQYFQSVQESDFLMGRVKDFSASLSWLVKPKNFENTLNGNYKNRPFKSSSPIQKTTQLEKNNLLAIEAFKKRYGG